MNSPDPRAAVSFRSPIALALCAFFWTIATAGTYGGSCKPLTDVERARLAEYVQKKYKLPPAARLILSGESLVGATCFRKLGFKSADPNHPFLVELFLSPDFRFLTRELLDSSIDPLLEERRKQRALNAGLTAGVFPSLGPKDAPVTIVIFSNFQCPYCARMAGMLTKEILPAERKTVRLVFRHFPLSGHNWALAAAQTTACAGEQGDEYFWRLHDFIFERQHEFTPDSVASRIAAETKRFRGFDSARFSSCVAGRKTAKKIDLDIAFGTQNGVNGTPTLFVNGRPTTAVAAPEQIRTLIREAQAQSMSGNTRR